MFYKNFSFLSFNFFIIVCKTKASNGQKKKLQKPWTNYPAVHFSVCAAWSTESSIVPPAAVPCFLIIKHRHLAVNLPLLWCPQHCSGNSRAIVLHLNAGLGEGRRGQKARQLSHAEALWGFAWGTEAAESGLQVNRQQHKRNKTGIVQLNSHTCLSLTFEACGHRSKRWTKRWAYLICESLFLFAWSLRILSLVSQWN